ncbi:MAG: DUF1552 domain-containing protein [Myxococcota bacterium]
MKRRDFLGRAALSSGVLLPYLRGWPSARAQTQTPPTRLVFFTSGNESIEPNRWLLPVHAHDRPLQRLHPLMASLESYRPRLSMFGHHIVAGCGHPAEKSVLTGMNEGEGRSIDQHVADAWGVTSLVYPDGNLSYRGPNAPATRLRAHQAFSLFFGDGTGTLPPEVLARRAIDESILDVLSGQLGSMRTRISREDHYKLDAHLEGLRSIEKRLESDLVVCEGATPPSPDLDRHRADRFSQDDVRMDVMVQALACEATRVGVFTFGGTWGIPNAYLEAEGIRDSSHNVAHAYDEAPSPVSIERREIMERITYEKFARFLDKLDAVPEGDGTLLDHTVVVFTKWMGTDHTCDRVMWLVAGGQKNTGIRHDRYFDMNDRVTSDLVAGLATLVGVPTPSWGAPQSFFEQQRGDRRRGRVIGALDLTS